MFTKTMFAAFVALVVGLGASTEAYAAHASFCARPVAVSSKVADRRGRCTIGDGSGFNLTAWKRRIMALLKSQFSGAVLSIVCCAAAAAELSRTVAAAPSPKALRETVGSCVRPW